MAAIFCHSLLLFCPRFGDCSQIDGIIMESEKIVMERTYQSGFASFTNVDLLHKSVFSAACDLWFP